MAERSDASCDNVVLHLKKIYAEEELSEAATAEESSVVQVEGDPAQKELMIRLVLNLLGDENV